MNNQLVKGLIDVIEKESKIYEDILEISKNKTDIIVKGKVKELRVSQSWNSHLLFR